MKTNTLFGALSSDSRSHDRSTPRDSTPGAVGRVALSLELFERDVQTILNDYLGGSIPRQVTLRLVV